MFEENKTIAVRMLIERGPYGEARVVPVHEVVDVVVCDEEIHPFFRQDVRRIAAMKTNREKRQVSDKSCDS